MQRSTLVARMDCTGTYLVVEPLPGLWPAGCGMPIYKHNHELRIHSAGMHKTTRLKFRSDSDRERQKRTL